MKVNIITFHFPSLISHDQHATAQVMIDTLLADIYCVSETHLKSRNNTKFTGNNIIRNDINNGSAFLVQKDYRFEEVVTENLLASSSAATVVKTADNSVNFDRLRLHQMQLTLSNWAKT